MAVAKKSESYFTIDWFDFKERMLRYYRNGDTSSWLTINRNSAARHMDGGTWNGFTKNQAKRWLEDGFHAETIAGLSDMVPPIRDKRKLIFGEEGDEFHYDLLQSGDDNYMSHFSKRETIPGIAIEAGIMFASGVSERTVGAYAVWICRIAHSLESAGVDCQITLDFPSWNMMSQTAKHLKAGKRSGEGTLYHNVVRVKKENEASDFLSWSAMLSPAALRGFGFTLGDLHADYLGVPISGTFGRGVPERFEWKVKYDADRRTIVVENQYMSSGWGDIDFPETKMTDQFRAALREMQGKN